MVVAQQVRIEFVASRLGGYAVDLLMQGEPAKGVGIKNNKIVATSLMKF